MHSTKKSKLTFSIIIPTYKREPTLKIVLDSILANLRSEIQEILIIDDSEDKNLSKNTSFTKNHKIQLLFTGHKGAAAARNVGIRKAKGDIIIFFDDDVIVTQKCIESHITFHTKNLNGKATLVGRTVLDYARQTPNDITIFLHARNYQFATPRQSKNIGFRYFYSCNLSVKRTFLVEGGMFDEAFSSAVYDDLELGVRLENRGMKLAYDKDCLAYHIKNYTIDAVRIRYENMGVFAKKLADKHPHLLNTFIFLTPRLSEKIYIKSYLLFSVIYSFKIKPIYKYFYKSLIATSFFKKIS